MQCPRVIDEQIDPPETIQRLGLPSRRSARRRERQPAPPAPRTESFTSAATVKIEPGSFSLTPCSSQR